MLTSSTSKTTILRPLSWDGLHAGSASVGSKGKEKLLRKYLLSKITAGRLSCLPSQRLFQMGHPLPPTAWGPSTGISTTTSAWKKLCLLHKQTQICFPEVNILEKNYPIKPGLLCKWFDQQSFFEASVQKHYFYNKFMLSEVDGSYTEQLHLQKICCIGWIRC